MTEIDNHTNNTPLVHKSAALNQGVVDGTPGKQDKGGPGGSGAVINKRKLKIDPDMPRKKRLDKEGPPYFHFPWLFFVPDGSEGGTLKTFEELPADIQEKIKAKFDAVYIKTQGWKPVNSYGTVSNNPELQAYKVKKHDGRWCIASGMRNPTRLFRYTDAGGNTKRACDSCSKEGRPCGKFTEINGEFKIVFNSRAEIDRANCKWTDTGSGTKVECRLR
ncbi:hypothetical protein K491DRAFT_784454 [Lophiostoma macrostomum CBS 122681]|uniref:Uncharacterized protein n=1 Tax=Lophiostoma macrostomum CBS 122681 TaxID=1314788 RepID=A0A6A6SJD6_9PLEO|nr:hypothetical protein K491DRAFT_784454 [Lophiostoma macrostomum CBS 122681]